MLILVSGPPGVGKSTLTRGLAPRLKAFVLDKDCVDEPFSPGDRGHHYTQNIEPNVLQALLNLAELNLSLGATVILDVPWTHILLNFPEWQKKLQQLAARTKTDLEILELVIHEPELRRRLQDRGLARDACKLMSPADWEVFRRSDRLGEVNPLPHTVLDASLPPEEVLSFALTHLTSLRTLGMLNTRTSRLLPER
jgi:predicted kinase